MPLGFHDLEPSPTHHVDLRVKKGYALSWDDEVGMAVEKLLDDIGVVWESVGYTYHIGINLATDEQRRRAIRAIKSWFPEVLVNKVTEWDEEED